jgi:general nucleoside transport system permease protein
VAAVAQAAAEEVSSARAGEVLDRTAQRKGRALCLVAGLIGLVAIGLFGRGAGDATFVLSPRGEDILDFAVPAGPTVLVLGLLALTVSLAGWVAASPKRAPVILALAMVLFVAAMLVWATAEGTTSLVGLANGTLRRATPLILGGLAGVLCERSGVVNIAIEGMLLGGAFAGAIVGSATGNSWIGVVGGMAAGALLAGMLSGLAIGYKVDQIVDGTAVNILALGLTSYLAAVVLTEHPDLNRTEPFLPFEIPVLSEIPFLGAVVFTNTPHVYAAVVLSVVIWFVLFRTRWGLRVRSVGEHPSAADTVGISVPRIRYQAVLLGGAVAGLGGTYFTLDSSSQFQENMTAGRGFIALAAMIFGRWHPIGVLGAALVFGFAEEFQGRLSSLGTAIPSEFLLMAPYIVTLVVVAGLVGKARPPAADGKPFER